MIDEKKLIEEFEKCMNDTAYLKNKYSGAAQLKDCTGKNIMYDHAEIAHDVISEVIEKINEQPKVGEWIPVSERLPNEEEFKKDDGRFMLDDGNRRYQGLFDIYDGCFKFSKHISGLNYELFEDKCVIAWQPLPESYKEDKEMGGDSDGQKDFKAISSVEARAREAGEKD